jgi:hypothetical protein
MPGRGPVYTPRGVSSDPQQERKKAVLAALTGLLRASPVGESIDPKAFMMLLNANYAALCPGNRMDLALLWSSLAAQRPHEELAPLFLKFIEAGERLGFSVEVPRPIAELPPDARAELLARFDRGARTPTTPAPVGRGLPTAAPNAGAQARTTAPSDPRSSMPAVLPSVPTGARLQPLPAQEGVPTDSGPTTSGGPAAIRRVVATPLSSGTPLPSAGADGPDDYTPTPNTASAFAQIPDEAQRRIVTALVGVVRQTTLGERVSGAQLNYFLASRFSQLFDGERFFFAPVHTALMELEGVDEGQVFLAATRFRRWLARNGVELLEPAWRLSIEQRAELERQAMASIAVETYSTRSDAPEVVPFEPEIEAAPEEQPTSAEGRREARLRALGLRGWTIPRIVRLAAIMLACALIGLGIKSLDPIRALSLATYDAALPLVDAALVDGAWTGTLDEERWKKLPYRARKEALDNLAATLKAEDRLKRARIVSQRSRTSIGFEAKERLLMADAFMYLGIPRPQPTPSTTPSTTPTTTPEPATAPPTGAVPPGGPTRAPGVPGPGAR